MHLRSACFEHWLLSVCVCVCALPSALLETTQPTILPAPPPPCTQDFQRFRYDVVVVVAVREKTTLHLLLKFLLCWKTTPQRFLFWAEFVESFSPYYLEARPKQLTSADATPAKEASKSSLFKCSCSSFCSMILQGASGSQAASCPPRTWCCTQQLWRTNLG